MTPQTIARALGIRFDGEQQWPGQPPCWAFTDTNCRSVTYSFTFYMPVGASFEQVRDRYREKQVEGIEATEINYVKRA